MKPPLARYLAAAFLFASATFLFADDFKSMVIAGGGSLDPIRVHGDQFMVIRNFTQEGSASSTRGVVTVTTRGGTVMMADVLTAAILDMSTTPPLEVINSVVIAGPADVTVTCGAPMMKNCFISYKKDSN
jgi:hypothetical protein